MLWPYHPVGMGVAGGSGTTGGSAMATELGSFLVEEVAGTVSASRTWKVCVCVCVGGGGRMENHWVKREGRREEG